MVAAIIILAPTMAIGVAGITMVAITKGKAMDMAEPSSDITHSEGKNCGTRLDGAVGAREATQSRTVAANCIAGTEIYLRVRGRRSWRPLLFCFFAFLFFFPYHPHFC